LLIATLIAANRLEERLIDACGARLLAWIEPGSAADVEFLVAPDLPEGVDYVPVGPGPRIKRLLVADMDSTIIGQECIDELADYAAVKPQVAAITERAMQGELDFAAALTDRVALLEGLDEAVLARCLAERVRLNPGAATLVRTMRAMGAETLLVSGGFTAFVAPVAAEAGFDRFEANVLEIAERRLTGRVTGRIVDSAFKRQALIDARDRLGLAREDVLAVGDGANDAPMIAEAGLGIAYRAKPTLARVADAELKYHGLDALLWAQGIPRADWVST
jgi:phosphoserine phosphatase